MVLFPWMVNFFLIRRKKSYTIPSSQGKVAWSNTSQSWNFLQCSTALWKDPCFSWKKQNSISLIGIPANPRPTQHWLCCTTCNHEAILDPTASIPPAPWSSWECDLIVPYSEILCTQISPSSFLSFEKRNVIITTEISIFSVTSAGEDSTWLLDSGGPMMPVLLFTLQLSTRRTWRGLKAVTTHAAVPRGGCKSYVDNKSNKTSARHSVSSVTMGLSTWTLKPKCEQYGKTCGLLTCVDTRLYDCFSGYSPPITSFGNINILYV